MAQPLLIVMLGGQRVAILALGVEAVVKIDAITPVPRAPIHIAGLTALRSRVLTVVDFFSTGAEVVASRRDAIVVEVDGHHYALLVDAVEEVVEGEGIQPLRTELAVSWRRMACGMVRVGGDLLLLVDVATLLGGDAALAA